jgi:hypothetical protein
MTVLKDFNLNSFTQNPWSLTTTYTTLFFYLGTYNTKDT